MLVSSLGAETPAAGDAAGIIFRFLFFSCCSSLRHAQPGLVERHKHRRQLVRRFRCNWRRSPGKFQELKNRGCSAYTWHLVLCLFSSRRLYRRTFDHLYEWCTTKEGENAPLNDMGHVQAQTRTPLKQRQAFSRCHVAPRAPVVKFSEHSTTSKCVEVNCHQST